MLDSSSPAVIPGLSAVADRFDAFIVDLWGTVHDGLRPYPGAVDCLLALKRAGKRVCLLSNAPRRVGSVTAKLDGMDVPHAAYDFVLSSGEAAHEALANRNDPWHARLGNRCFHLGPPRDDDVHQGIGLEMVDDVADAEFVLCTGIDAVEESVETHAPVLRAAVARRLPLICANPDLIVMTGEVMSICAGELARFYETLGGDVFYHGKPHRPVYETCFRRLGVTDPQRALGIGDALRTDVAGANAAGARSLLLTGGIHAEEFGLVPGEPVDPARLADAIAREGVAPDYVGFRLTW